MDDKLLEVKELYLDFYKDGKTIRALENISFHVNRGEILGIVGESGCGKSVTSLSIMRLIPPRQGKVTHGQALFAEEDLLQMSRHAFSQITGNQISMIFQEPLSSLNPLKFCGDQIAETLIFHLGMRKKQAAEKTVELLRQVGIPAPEKRAKEYPYQLSGGMRQRVMIAMAIACNPKLLIADEPTTALDVTIQAQILELLRRLQKELGMSVMFITHDMGVVAEMCTRVMVMYAGSVVEEADVDLFFEEPLHPYTQGLLKAIPGLSDNQSRLFVIPGSVPELSKTIHGCKFCDRCCEAMERCRREKPPMIWLNDHHRVACWKWAEVERRECDANL